MYNCQMNEAELRQLLSGVPLSDLRYQDTTGSTNDDAIAWAEQDAPDGAIVTANEQTNGRGRNRRIWITRPDQALAFSVIFRPTPAEAHRLAFYSPMSALAVCAMLEKLGLKPLIKWPNDVLLNRKKISGILVEGIWQGSVMKAIVSGIGINIATNSLNLSDPFLFPASSIEQELGHTVNRWEILKEVLLGLFFWRSKIMSEEFIQAWESRLAFQGEMVRIEQNEQLPVIGKLDGIDHESGSLRIITASGKIELIEAGDVHLRLADNG